MFSPSVRRPALTKHCPFAQGFCSWQISLRGEHPFGPYPLPVYPDVQEQNAMGPWEMRQDTEGNSVYVTMTIPMFVNVLDILKQNLYIILTYLIFWHLPWSVPSLTMERAMVLFCYGHLHGKWWVQSKGIYGKRSSKSSCIIGKLHQRKMVNVSTVLGKSLLFGGAKICFCQCLWKSLLALANLPVKFFGWGKTDCGEGAAI